MNGLELDRRVRDAMYHKWGEVWQVDLDATVAQDGDLRLPLTVRDLIDNVVADCSLIYNRLVPIERYEEPWPPSPPPELSSTASIPTESTG